MISREADPGDLIKGPINAIKPVLKFPSHHGPEVMTICPEIVINSMTVEVSTTIMHVHAIVVTFSDEHGINTQSILDLWHSQPRVFIMNGSETGIKTTAEVMEFDRAICPKWGALQEIFICEDGVKIDGNLLYYFQAIHQESDVIPENVDVIQALMGLGEDWHRSVSKTDTAITVYNGL